MTQYRLKARAELNGAIREPGYVFTLTEGERGPHRTVVASNHGAQITDHMNAEQELVDEPLFEEIKEVMPLAKSPQEIHNEKLERVDAAKRELDDAERDLAAFVDERERDLAAKPGAPLLLEAPESNLPKRV